MKKLLLAAFLIFNGKLFAQQRKPELITDRPDQTESSVTVPKSSLQIESGFLYEKYSSQANKAIWNTTLLRYGLLENMEMRLGWEASRSRTALNGRDDVTVAQGLSPLSLGFKVNIQKGEGFKPSIGFLASVELPFSASSSYITKGTGASMRFSLEHDLSEKFSMGYNLGADWSGENAYATYAYTFVVGYSPADRLGLFAELYGFVPEDRYREVDAEHLFNAGFTYSIAPMFQWDVSAGTALSGELDYFISTGFVVRLFK
ncbi:MAG: transporter [Cytophagales bacterium]|nr:transporter [Cytophagales bacterium]